jgi:hypothetical protein
MTTILTIAGVWIGASFILGPIIGGALKSLSRDWHEAERSGQ